ncbi:NusG domain II-containing protein [Roseburia hominis]|uniref:NusG domain II-containing protein n=1 Tax=Roseburia hominis TaxID=301301 RepID=UPI0026EDF981|nr:NusG domain II-containing protein [Roseburia hominis]MCI7523933.1 NusG domain II-containing protein [Roseburia hominis]
MKKRISRNDVIFLVILLTATAGVLVAYERTVTRADAGASASVRVTVDGSVYGTYALGEEQEIPIVQDGVTTNVLTIRDGKADMTEADCPDKLCVHQKAISKNHEMIVCLPNKVVVEVTGSEDNGFDSIAR